MFNQNKKNTGLHSNYMYNSALDRGVIYIIHMYTHNKINIETGFHAGL